MPQVKFQGQVIRCDLHANLRRVLLQSRASGSGVSLYNGIAKQIHCRGLGTCGTCAIKVDGEVSEMTRIEKWRLNFPPHRASPTDESSEPTKGSLRLACQCRVLGDLVIRKQAGLWGHKTDADPDD